MCREAAGDVPLRFHQSNFEGEIVGWVHEAIDEGSLRDDIDPDVVSRLLFGMVNSLVEWHRPGGPVAPETLSRAVATVAFDGLAR